MHKAKIAVLLPGEQFSSAWVNCWTMLLGHLMENYKPEVMFGYASIVNVTRSSMIKMLLDSNVDYDYVLWIDDDNMVEPKHFEHLMIDLEMNEKLDGVVGWCYCQANGAPTEPLASCGSMTSFTATPFSLDRIRHSTKALELIDYSGFPVALHRFEVYKRLGHQVFAPILTDENPYGFCGEDIAFYHRAAKMRMKFAVDLRVKVPHLKLRDANVSAHSEMLDKASSVAA